jgi:hypoxanthine-guanine phosphoribosyltransferase
MALTRLRVLIPAEKIAERVRELGSQIDADYPMVRSIWLAS